MGLQTAMINSLTSWNRTIRLLFRKLILFIRLLLPFFRNYNTRHAQSGIAQPAYYNSWKDVSAKRTVEGLHWVNDLKTQFKKDQVFYKFMDENRYDEIVRAYFPTNISPFETINLKRTWINSYWNPKNKLDRSKGIFNNNDILFADMYSNTQNMYKIRKVLPNSQIFRKAQIFFQKMLEQNRNNIFCGDQNPQKPVLEYLIENQNLFYCNFEELRKMEDNQMLRRQVGGQKYRNLIKTTNRNEFYAYLEIPFAIFAKLNNPFQNNKPTFLCLGSVFNETYKKTIAEDVEESQIYSPFYSDEMGRDRWQMAKSHMASADTNDFTIRTHLGILHYATSIYTCAFCNIGRDNPQLSWLKDQFIDVFSRGLLQIDFNANLTLIDHLDPMAEKVFYIKREQAAEMILRENSKFNILEYCPEGLGKDAYISDIVKISHSYYDKLRIYVDYLICKYWDTVQNPSKIYKQLLMETCDQIGKMDGLPNEIMQQTETKTLRKIMTNLAYQWVIVHAQTFSLVSVASPFYYVPSIMRKPLSELKKYTHPMSESQKIQWLANFDIIRDNMTLHKVVTFRLPEDSLISGWNHLGIDGKTWKKFVYGRKPYLLQQDEQLVPEDYADFWNDISIKIQNLNNERLNCGLYILHWYQVTELPISLNV